MISLNNQLQPCFRRICARRSQALCTLRPQIQTSQRSNEISDKKRIISNIFTYAKKWQNPNSPESKLSFKKHLLLIKQSLPCITFCLVEVLVTTDSLAAKTSWLDPRRLSWRWILASSKSATAPGKSLRRCLAMARRSHKSAWSQRYVEKGTKNHGYLMVIICYNRI